jgi:hypothetical protein
MSHHVEPGYILKRTDGIKMATVSSDLTDIINELDYVEEERIDKDGNTVVVKVY